MVDGAMTPTIALPDTELQTARWSVVPLAHGCVAVMGDEEGLRASTFGVAGRDYFPGVPFVAAAGTDPDSPLGRAIRQLEAYASGKSVKFDVPLRPAGTPFQQAVWKAAVQIPWGQTRSYWWIAVRMGDPLKARAVGGALGANPLPVFIPCHRVLRQDGGLGGFSGGLDWKEALLRLECAGADLLSPER